MIRCKDVRESVGVTRDQIYRYRKAGLITCDPIGVSHGDYGNERVYPDEVKTVLEVLEGLRQRGFTIPMMRVLLDAFVVAQGMGGSLPLDEEYQVDIPLKRLDEGRKVIDLVIKFYNRQPGLPRSGGSSDENE